MGKGDEDRNQRRIDEQDRRNQRREDVTFDADVRRRDRMQTRADTEHATIWDESGQGGSRYIDTDPRDRARDYISGGLAGIEDGRARWGETEFAGGGNISPAGSSGGGGGGGGGATDYFGDSDSGYKRFANSGGVDMGALTENLGGLRKLSDFSTGLTPQGQAGIRSNINRLSDISQSGGFNPASIRGNIGRLSEIGKTGGFDPSAIRGDIGSLREFGKTGGFDPSALYGDAASLREFGQSGGLNPESVNRFRGLGGYKDFANTGGITDADRANIRHRVTSGIPSAYTDTMRGVDQLGSIQGGYSPGLAAAKVSAGRRIGQDVSDATRQAELDISDRVRAGRQWGIKGLTDSENALQSLRTGNMFQGRQAAGNLGLGIEGLRTDNMFKGREAAMKGGLNLEGLRTDNMIRGAGGAASAETGLEGLRTANMIQSANQAGGLGLGLEESLVNADVKSAGVRRGALGDIGAQNLGAQGLKQGGQLAGLGGMERIAGARTQADFQREAAGRASAAASRASEADAYRRNWDEFRYFNDMENQNNQYFRGMGANNEQFNQQQFGTGQSIADQRRDNLYGSSVGQAESAGNRALGGAGTFGGLGAGTVNQDYNSSNIQGGFGGFMDNLGAAAGIGGAIMGGVSGMGGMGGGSQAPIPSNQIPPGIGMGRGTWATGGGPQYVADPRTGQQMSVYY